MDKKRVTVKLKRPNPLFEEWLTEWRDAERSKKSKLEHAYDRALMSLRKYPLPLQSGRDCIILAGFGERLCRALDDRLKSTKNRNGVSEKFADDKDEVTVSTDNGVNGKKECLPVYSLGGQNGVAEKIANNKDIAIMPTDNQSVVNGKKEYLPVYRSGGYGILIALYKDSLEADSKGHMLKGEIVAAAQPHCDKSYLKSDSNYTAWSSMSTLITKGLVLKSGNPARFTLSDAGVLAAHKLLQQSRKATNDSADIHKNPSNIEAQIGKQTTIDKFVKQGAKSKFQKNPSCSSIASEASTAASSQEESFVLTPNSFDVLLLVDKQETSGSKNSMFDQLILDLEQLAVRYELRNLKVGDYAWISRGRACGRELVLPYVVERKRMDDFGASIKDGRFHEQKFRLKQSGVRNPIYLIESHGRNTHVGLPLTTLFQAATNTLVQDGFAVRFTENGRATTEYLATLTNILRSKYETKTLMSCPKENLVDSSLDNDLIPLMTFKEFNQRGVKKKALKVCDLFIKQLLQLKGVSVDKALAIVEKYPTPRSLKLKYDECSPKEGEALLASVEFGKLRKKIGPALSRTIWQLYTRNRY